jgi:hypothetical protein
VLIHRVSTAGIGVLCQLECEGPFRAEVLKWMPGYGESATLSRPEDAGSDGPQDARADDRSDSPRVARTGPAKSTARSGPAKDGPRSGPAEAAGSNGSAQPAGGRNGRARGAVAGSAATGAAGSGPDAPGRQAANGSRDVAQTALDARDQLSPEAASPPA